MKLLIAEDDPDIAFTYETGLKEEKLSNHNYFKWRRLS